MNYFIHKNKHTKISTISLLALTIALIALVSTASTVNANFESLQKQHSPTGVSFNQGDTVTYTVTLNVLDAPGGSAISIYHLNITDVVPAGLTYVAGSSTSTPAATFTQTGQQLFWDFGVATVLSTAPQAVVSFRATVNTGTTGNVINNATASYIGVQTQTASNPGAGDLITVLIPPSPTPIVTQTPFPSQPPSVGGEFAPVSILQLLAPYLVVAFIGAIAVASLVMYRKRTE